MIYYSRDLKKWENALLLSDTPETGYNSDPNVFVEGGHNVYAFWRECETPSCSLSGGKNTIVGGLVNEDGVHGIAHYLVNHWQNGDYVQCPILIKQDDVYCFYTVWYQYSPTRKNKGIAIWKGNSLDNPDFTLTDTLEFDNPLICDKWVQKRIGRTIYYIPKPKRYDLWHFDLFEHGGKLYMVSCAEKDDNIMLSVSEDWKHFKTRKEPLINNHFSENYTGYRQYYYKPTAIVHNDSLYLYYTANAKDDRKRNQLYLSVQAIKELGL